MRRAACQGGKVRHNGRIGNDETAEAHHSSAARWAASEPEVGWGGKLQAAPKTQVATLAGMMPCATASTQPLDLLLRLLSTEPVTVLQKRLLLLQSCTKGRAPRLLVQVCNLARLRQYDSACVSNYLHD